MTNIRLLAGCALAFGLSSSPVPAGAATADYRFELAGKPRFADGKDFVQVRLIHIPDGKPVPDAVIFEAKADMGPGMETMTGPVTALPAKDGVYGFAVDPNGMAGTWSIHLAAKVQGEAETVRGVVTADLAK